jgi:hypothetical protein
MPFRNVQTAHTHFRVSVGGEPHIEHVAASELLTNVHTPHVHVLGADDDDGALDGHDDDEGEDASVEVDDVAAVIADTAADNDKQRRRQIQMMSKTTCARNITAALPRWKQRPGHREGIIKIPVLRNPAPPLAADGSAPAGCGGVVDVTSRNDNLPNLPHRLREDDEDDTDDIDGDDDARVKWTSFAT